MRVNVQKKNNNHLFTILQASHIFLTDERTFIIVCCVRCLSWLVFWWHPPSYRYYRYSFHSHLNSFILEFWMPLFCNNCSSSARMHAMLLEDELNHDIEGEYARIVRTPPSPPTCGCGYSQHISSTNSSAPGKPGPNKSGKHRNSYRGRVPVLGSLMTGINDKAVCSSGPIYNIF